MDMDILQTIFLHYIAISWCEHLKSVFSRIPHDTKVCNEAEMMTQEEKARYNFFMGSSPHLVVAAKEMKTFRETFFMSLMPSSLAGGGGPYGEDKMLRLQMTNLRLAWVCDKCSCANWPLTSLFSALYTARSPLCDQISNGMLLHFRILHSRQCSASGVCRRIG